MILSLAHTKKAGFFSHLRVQLEVLVAFVSFWFLTSCSSFGFNSLALWHQSYPTSPGFTSPALPGDSCGLCTTLILPSGPNQRVSHQQGGNGSCGLNAVTITLAVAVTFVDQSLCIFRAAFTRETIFEIGGTNLPHQCNPGQSFKEGALRHLPGWGLSRTTATGCP